MNTAARIKTLPGFRGNAVLYRCTPPLTRSEYNYDTDEYASYDVDFVIASTAHVPYTGVETYLFPSNENGDIISWSAMDGSTRGESDHAVVFNNIGYAIEGA